MIVATRPKRVIVVAMARNRVIGRDNGLPWHLPSDLKHFKSVTMGRPMIMGRTTFESIGKPLSGRTTIVLTRDPAFSADGILVVTSLNEAFSIAETIAARDGSDAIMITGGGQIYAQALPFADRVIVSEVEIDAEGSVQFPVLNPKEWQEMSRIAGDIGPRDAAAYEIVTYERSVAASR